MRLFATGLMQRVMDKSFPDDVPLESKMVSKAVERAQGTVEDRNFEIRKDVLKYDEVMNEQRKVIYRRRQQILDGEDLRDEADRRDRVARSAGSSTQYCRGEFAEDWDARRAARQTRARYFPTRITKEQLDDVIGDAKRSSELLHRRRDRALRGEGSESIGAETLRDIERRVMLSVIDQHWREHLYEMDYLQEGINLRAMGQQDPLVGVAARGLRHVRGDDGPDRGRLRRATCSTSRSWSTRSPRARRSATCSTARRGSGAGLELDREPPWPPRPAEAPLALRRRRGADGRCRPSRCSSSRCGSRRRPGRNEPCFCGSGKKYKLCHGR